MDPQQISLFFSLAERPIKILINSYFEQFQNKTKLDLCEKLGVSTKRFPNDYYQHGELACLTKEGVVSDKFLQHNSLLKIPPKVGEIKVAKELGNEYLLFLDVVSKDCLWDETIFDPFRDIDQTKDQVTAIKGHVGHLMKIAQFVFATLKKNNDKLLET